jgi:hypothetical protein
LHGHVFFLQSKDAKTATESTSECRLMKFVTANGLAIDDKFVECLVSVFGELDKLISDLISENDLAKFSKDREKLGKQLKEMNDQQLSEHCRKDREDNNNLKANRNTEKLIT